MSAAERIELRRAQPLLGTIVEIRVRGNDSQLLARAVDRAFAAVKRVDGLMSFHSRSSDVTRLNRSAWKRALRVHPWTYEVLREAQRVSRASRGLFDITVASTLVRDGQLPRQRGVPTALARASYRDVLLRSGARVRFRVPLLIDLSGIAKGYAVDRAVRVLQSAGAHEGVVNAGGDLRVFGREPQTVHVRHPDRPDLLLPLAQLRSGALATSAGYVARGRTGTRETGALVRPGRAGSFSPRGSASVAAAKCVHADAWTKVALLGGTSAAGLRRSGARGRLITAARSGGQTACA
jgi:thiamine biosynthesis lipoprotein